MEDDLDIAIAADIEQYVRDMQRAGLATNAVLDPLQQLRAELFGPTKAALDSFGKSVGSMKEAEVTAGRVAGGFRGISIAGIAMKATVVGLVASIGYDLVRSFTDSDEAQKEHQKQLEATIKLYEKMGETIHKDIVNRMKLENMGSGPNSTEQNRLDAITEMEERIRSFNKEIEKLEGDNKKLEKAWGDFGGIIPGNPNNANKYNPAQMKRENDERILGLKQAVKAQQELKAQFEKDSTLDKDMADRKRAIEEREQLGKKEAELEKEFLTLKQQYLREKDKLDVSEAEQDRKANRRFNDDSSIQKGWKAELDTLAKEVEASRQRKAWEKLQAELAKKAAQEAERIRKEQEREAERIRKFSQDDFEEAQEEINNMNKLREAGFLTRKIYEEAAEKVIETYGKAHGIIQEYEFKRHQLSLPELGDTQAITRPQDVYNRLLQEQALINREKKEYSKIGSSGMAGILPSEIGKENLFKVPVKLTPEEEVKQDKHRANLEKLLEQIRDESRNTVQVKAADLDN